MIQLKESFYSHLKLLATAGVFSTLVFSASAAGWLQPMEWFVFDRFFRLRASQAIDPRILVVTLDEADISNIGDWPLSDDLLAELLLKINDAKPRAIGLDMYRNLPVGEGYDKLREAFETLPNLVGVEKALGQTIDAPPGLNQEQQVGMSDIVVDEDGTVRRALLSALTENGKQRYGLGTRLAFKYLEQKQIYPHVLDSKRLQLGKATLRRFQSHDGGYANADAGGTQILINFPAGNTFFETVSVRAVLKDQVPAAQIQDRIVLIGSTAISLNDFFPTPVSQEQEMSGVFIHAHIVSQLVGAALDGRVVLNGISLWGEGLWIFLSSYGSSLLLYRFLQKGKAYRRQNILTGIWLVPCLSISIGTFSYGMFTLGLWVPVIAPLLSVSSLSMLFLLQQNQKLMGLAAFDELTQIPNRRSFEQHLQESIDQQKSFTLVLCDVDYFKRYNDTYGHQAGDVCLAAIAKALARSIRESDLAARYGGEEFVLILSGTAATSEILDRIQERVASLGIKHEASDVSDHVTLSFGVVNTKGVKCVQPKTLVKSADQSLYEAKRQGRNQYVFGTLISEP